MNLSKSVSTNMVSLHSSSSSASAEAPIKRLNNVNNIKAKKVDEAVRTRTPWADASMALELVKKVRKRVDHSQHLRSIEEGMKQ